jgi:hypothetical protein
LNDFIVSLWGYGMAAERVSYKKENRQPLVIQVYQILTILQNFITFKRLAVGYMFVLCSWSVF